MEHDLIHAGRITSILHSAIADFLLKIANKDPLITVSHIQLNQSGRSATVYCSVFPEERQEQSIAFLRRKGGACKAHIRTHTSLRVVPTIRFLPAKHVPDL